MFSTFFCILTYGEGTVYLFSCSSANIVIGHVFGASFFLISSPSEEDDCYIAIFLNVPDFGKFFHRV